MKLGMQVGLGLANIVLAGDPAPPRKEIQQPPLSKFARPYDPRSMSMAKRLDGSRRNLERR